MLGHPVHRSTEPEATLRGAAVYALEKMGLGLDPEILDQSVIGAAVQPRARYARQYAIERRKQQRLEALISKLASP